MAGARLERGHTPGARPHRQRPRTRRHRGGTARWQPAVAGRTKSRICRDSPAQFSDGAGAARDRWIGRLVRGLGSRGMGKPGPGATVLPVHGQRRIAWRYGQGAGSVAAGGADGALATAKYALRSAAQRPCPLRPGQRFLFRLAWPVHDLFVRQFCWAARSQINPGAEFRPARSGPIGQDSRDPRSS